MQYQRLAVAFTIDNGYTNQLKVVLYSLLKHKKVSTVYDIYLLAYQFNPANFASLEQVLKEHDVQGACTLTYLPISDDDYQRVPLFREVSFGGGWGRESLNRIFLPQYLPYLEKILYLDADILIQDDLSDLLQVDLTNKALAGVLDPFHFEEFAGFLIHTYRIAQLMQLNDDEYVQKFFIHNYINSGVLFLNLSFWRDHCLGEKMLKIIQKIYTHGASYFPDPQDGFDYSMETPFAKLYPDQDIINYLIFKEQLMVSFLPCTYNFSPHFLMKSELKLQKSSFNAWIWLQIIRINALVKHKNILTNSIKILHYVGPHKPWSSASVAFADLYKSYAEVLGWHISYPNKTPPKENFFREVIKMLLPHGVIRYIQVQKKKRTS